MCLAMASGQVWLWLLLAMALISYSVSNAVEKVAKDDGVKKAAKDGVVNMLHRWLK